MVKIKGEGIVMLKVNLNEKDSLALVEPEGKLTKTDFVNASQVIDSYIEKNGNLKGIIVYVEDFPFWDSFSSLISHLKFIHNHHRLVSHIAFVTDSMTGDFAQNIADHFLKAKIKHFDYKDLEEAKTWIQNDDYITHGLYFSCETSENNIFIKFKAIGKLTHEDYEKISPVIDTTLENIVDPKVNILVDIEELEGWELRAAWDDLKLGLKHGKEFNKIAIYGHKSWQELASKIGSLFVSGEVKSFESMNEAIKWLDEN